jgi:hypothetical protein
MIIFGILGIFSATHRKIAIEAFDCVFRKVTLRKCNTGLDVRLKSSITGKSFQKHPKLGKFIYKHFEIISGMFTILLIGSLIWTGISGYNYYVYGNCNGPSVEDQQGLCLFDPSGENSQISTCGDEDIISQTEGSEPTLNDVKLSMFPTYKYNGYKDSLVYVGCYTCPNTRNVNPTINKLVSENQETLKFTYVHLPLHKEHEYISKISNCLYAQNKDAFWDFHNVLMQMPTEDVKDKEIVTAALKTIESVDADGIIACSETKASEVVLSKQLEEIKKMNVEGTPTIFVNDQVFIGPKPLRVYERQLSTNVDWFGMGLIGLGVLILLVIVYYAVFKRD